MKKLFFFASAAALLATSCSDDLGFKDVQTGPLAEGNTTLIATYNMGDAVDASDDEAETRTSLGNVGGTLKYSWSNGDAIGVYGMNYQGSGAFSSMTGNALFAFSGATDTFYGDLDATSSTGLYAGYYPYNQQGAFFTTLPSNLASTATTGATISTLFLNQQNYNHKLAASQADFSVNPPTGSFSNGIAPSVAIGTSDGTNLYMDFQSVGSYLVVPIVSYSSAPVKINSLELQVMNTSGSPQAIAGTVFVDMAKLAGASDRNLVNSNAILGTTVTASPYTSTTAQTITLDCGEGVELNRGDKTNFWFVIPPLTSMAQNCQVVVNVNYETWSAQYRTWLDSDPTTITKTFGASNPNQNSANTANIGPNQVIVITPEKNQAYPLQTTADTFVIQTVAQFIEYAYLLSNGDAAAMLYSQFKNYNGALEYFGLSEMITFTSNNTVASIKNAMIAENLTFNKQNLEECFIGASDQLRATEYFKQVFGNYLSSSAPSISTIGGGVFNSAELKAQTEDNYFSVSISGNGNVNLNGLTISGNGLAQGLKLDPGKNWGTYLTLEDLTFNNLTVNAGYNSNNYMMTGNTDYCNFSGIVVNNTCKVSGTNANATNSLFPSDYSSNYKPTYNSNQTIQNGLESDITGVDNLTDYMFAVNLYINSAMNTNPLTNGFVHYDYDFSQFGHTISDFKNIYLQGNTGWSATTDRYGYGSVLKIADGQANAVSLMENIKTYSPQGVSTKAYSYSIIDSTTSYWTGGAYTALDAFAVPGTAEFLATLVQQGTTGALGTSTFTQSGYNLNLMGSYINKNQQKVNTNWWNGGYEGIVISGPTNTDGTWNTSNPLVISNVYIDGTKLNGTKTVAAYDSQNKYVYLNLLGYTSTVNNVTVNDLQINVADDILFNLGRNQTTSVLGVSAISGKCIGNNTNIIVNNMNVNMNGLYGWNGTTGGLYVTLNSDQITLPQNGDYSEIPLQLCSYEPLTGVTSPNLAGYVSGSIDITFGDRYYNEKTLVNPVSNADSNRFAFGNINVIINPSTNNYGSATLNLDGFDNVDEFVKGMNISVPTGNNVVQLGFPFFLKAGNVTYLWQYQGPREGFRFISSY